MASKEKNVSEENNISFTEESNGTVASEGFLNKTSEETITANETLAETTSEELSDETFLEGEIFFVEEEVSKKTLLTGMVSKIFDFDEVDTSKPFAVLVRFELPKGEENSFDFELVDPHFKAKIDPDVSGCGTLNTENALYILDSDSYSSSTCFEISATNVTLDCQGYEIVFGGGSNQGYGVRSTYDQTTVKNCIIRKTEPTTNFGAGILLYGSNSTLVENTSISVTGSHDSGVGIIESTDTLVTLSNISSQGPYGHAVSLTGPSEDNTLYSNELFTFGEGSAGVNLNSLSGADISLNNITTFGEDAPGANLYSLESSDIFDNTINTSGDVSYGLLSSLVSESTFSENLIFVSGEESYALYLEDTYSNTYDLNTLTTTGSYGVCIFSTDSSSDNLYESNTLTTIGDDRYGIYLVLNAGSTFENNTITTQGNNSHAMIIDEASDNTFSLLSLLTNGTGAAGIYFDGPSTNNIFSELTIFTEGTSANSVYLAYPNHNITFLNSFLETSSSEDAAVYVDFNNDTTTSGVFTFTNVSYDSGYWATGATALLERYWYLDVSVNSSENTSISGANVTLNGTEGGTTFTELTSAEGAINQKTLMADTQTNSSAIISYSNYTLYATGEGGSANETINLTENKVILLTLESPDETEENVSEEVETPSSSGGGGGGGSGGGSPCKPKWKCTKWSDCLDGRVTRECTNKNSCLGDTKPIILAACTEKDKRKKTLFDINLELLEDRISSLAEGLSVKIGLINLGVPGTVNASLYYELTDSSDEIVHVESEVVPVETQTEYLKTFDLSGFSEGEYSLLVDLTYKGQTEPASSRAVFRIGEETKSYLAHVLAGVLLLLIIFFVIRRLMKKRKNEDKELLLQMSRELKKEGGDFALNTKNIRVQRLYNRLRKNYHKLDWEGKEKIYPLIQKAFDLKN